MGIFLLRLSFGQVRVLACDEAHLLYQSSARQMCALLARSTSPVPRCFATAICLGRHHKVDRQSTIFGATSLGRQVLEGRLGGSCYHSCVLRNPSLRLRLHLPAM